jgi:hypothetical protein
VVARAGRSSTPGHADLQVIMGGPGCPTRSRARLPTDEVPTPLFAFIEHGLDSRRSHLTVLYYCTNVLIQYEEEMTPDDLAVGVLRA